MANKTFHSSTVTFLDRTDERKLEVYISSNHPTVQIKNQNTGEYTPNWSTTNLQLSADVFIDSQDITADSQTTIKWYTKIGNTETLVGSGESLKISTNVLVSNPIITYICKAAYQNVNAMSQLTFTRVDTGLNGTDGTGINIKGTATSVTAIPETEYYMITYEGSDISNAGLNDSYLYKGDLYTCVDSRDGIDYFMNVGRIQGPKGEDAKSIILTGSAQVFKVSKTNVYAPLTISVTAIPVNTSITEWTYSINGGHTFLSTVPTGVVRNGNTVTITGSTFASNSLVIKASDGQYGDVFTIYKAFDGADGTKGDAASMAFLTNENTSFPAGADGKTNVLTTFRTNVVSYDGTEKVKPVIGAIINLPDGMSVIPNKGTAYAKVELTADNAIISDLYSDKDTKNIISKSSLTNGDSFVVGDYLYKYDATSQKFKSNTVTVDGVTYLDRIVTNNEITLLFSVPTGKNFGKDGNAVGEIAIPVISPVDTNLLLSWSKINAGATGVGIKSTTVSYGVSDSSSTQPTDWQSTIPAVAEGKYLWTRTIIDYTDEKIPDTVTYIYAKQGAKGDSGTAGSSVTVSSVQYQEGASATTAPTGTWSNAVVAVADGKYLWTKTAFSDGKTAYGVAKQGANGKDGVGISSITIDYGVSDNASTKPTSWQQSIPVVAEGKYLWTRTITDYTDTSVADTVAYVYAKQGIKGETGAAGSSVTVSSIQYQSGTSATTAPTGTWSDSVIAVSEGNYLWTKTTFSDGKVAYGVAKQGQKGNKGDQGAAGADAYTVLLTNESHVFAGSTSAAIASSATTQVLAYKGTAAQSVTIVSVNGVAAKTDSTATGITGLTFACSALSGTSPTITFTCSTSFVSPNGSIPIVLSVGGVSITKMFTYSIAFKGSTGATGGTGPQGSAATSYWLMSSASVVQKSASGTVVLTPSTLTFTGKSQTGTSTPIDYGCRWIIAYSTDGSTYTNAYTSTANETTKTFTVDSTYKTIRVRMYLAGGTTTLLDEQIIPVVADGAIGTPGADAVTFQVYSSNGYALSINTPTVTLQTFAYIGDVAITAGATYQWYVYNDSGWTAISGGTNAYLTITREDVAFSKSYMCKMTFNGVEYTSVATIDDKNDENKVFTTKPSNYAAGDIWVVGVDYAPAGVEVGTLLRAEHTNATYGDVDWVTATKYDKELDDLKNNIETYNQYFSFDSAEGLKISAKDNNGTPSQFSTSLTNERLSFNYGNEAIAYINGTKMNIKEAEIESPLTVTGKYSGSTMLQAPVINIGNFSIIVESNGSLSIVANI